MLLFVRVERPEWPLATEHLQAPARPVSAMQAIMLVVLASSIALPAAASGPLPDDIRINEVFYDADGSDGPMVFTELWGPPGVSLEGYELVGINGADGVVYRSVALDGGIIGDDGLFVIATEQARCLLAERADASGAIDWQNGPDTVQLRHSFALEPEIIDAVAYGAAPGQAGEGAVAPDVPAGRALTRDAQHTDTDDNAADLFSAIPSPGADGEEGALADDMDDDCVADAEDNCPFTPNTDQADGDGDGVGDACAVPPPVPEVGTLAMTSLGLALLVGIGIRRQGERPAE